MTIRNHIRDRRQQRGVTQEQLAAAVGVSRQTVISIEKENYTPSLLLAMQLAEFFDMSLEDLFYLTK